MLIQFAQFDPALLALVVFGVLTLFGRKKKDEKEEGAKPGNSASNTPSPNAAPDANPQVTNSSDLGNTGGSPNAAGPSEETDSLTRLLQSLMQDLPANPSSEADEAFTSSRSTPEYVPPRNDPPSRPMVVVSGGKGKRLEPLVPAETSEPVEPSPRTEVEPAPKREVEPAPKREVKPAEPPQASTRGSAGPALASGSAKPEGVEEEMKKLAKPEKPEKREKEARLETPRGPSSQAAQGFEHVFDLTQGSLKTPGLVVVTGPTGSGKTTLCLSLARSYLGQGSPCLFVAYDRPTSAVRDGMKKIGCDPAIYESQFRLLIVDGYSSQSEAFSPEPYNVERPFDLDNVGDVLVRNSQIFLGQRTAVIFDSLNVLVSRVPPKEFVSKFREIVGKLKETGAIFVVAVDVGKLSKDLVGPLQDMADCIIALDKEGPSGGRLRILKANGSDTKSEPEPFEIDTTKGLLFV